MLSTNIWMNHMEITVVFKTSSDAIINDQITTIWKNTGKI